MRSSVPCSLFPVPSRWIAGLALGLALPGCASLGGAPLDEAAELFTMGSQRPLREPMQPIRGTTRVLILALDGVGDDDLRRALREGRLPRLAALLGRDRGEGLYAHAYAAPGVLSVLPSSTLPAWAALFTGQPPGRTGVPGNEWFVREEMRFYAPVPVTVPQRTHALATYTDELLSRLLRAPTLYEGLPLRIHVSMNPVFRGADLLTLPNLAAFGDLFEELAEGAISGSASGNPDAYRETDQTSVRGVREAVAEHGLPDLQTVYFPGIDLYTHVTDSPLESQQRYLAEVIDPLIGQVLDLYRERDALTDTYVLVVADHGHTPVLADDRHSLAAAGEDEPPAVLRQAGFRLRPLSLSPERDDYQAVLAYQGAMAFVYLADRSTCPDPGDRCEWARPPRLAEDVLPVARAFHAASRTGAGVPELRGTLDLVLAREPRPAGAEPLPFQVFDGERLVPVREYLSRHPRPDLLDLERRLEALATGPYGHLAGEVLLLARSGAERPIEERYYFAAPSRSEHGSAHPQDSLVPLVVAHPARSGEELRERVRAVLGARPTQLEFAQLVRALLAR